MCVAYLKHQKDNASTTSKAQYTMAMLTESIKMLTEVEVQDGGQMMNERFFIGWAQEPRFVIGHLLARNQ